MGHSFSLSLNNEKDPLLPKFVPVQSGGSSGEVQPGTWWCL